MKWFDIDWLNVTDTRKAAPSTAAIQPSKTATILIAVPTNQLPPKDCPSMSSSQRPIAIGIAIGVPLAFAATGFLGYLFWKESVRRKYSQRRRPLTEVSEVSDGGMPPSFKSVE